MIDVRNPAIRFLPVHNRIIPRPLNIPTLLTRHIARLLSPLLPTRAPIARPIPMHPKLENMHRIMRTAHRQQRPHRIKIHTINPRLSRSPPELIQLLRAGDAPHPDHRALLGGRGEEGSGAVQGKGGQGSFVRADELGYGEGFGGKEEDVAGGLLGG